MQDLEGCGGELRVGGYLAARLGDWAFGPTGDGAMGVSFEVRWRHPVWALRQPTEIRLTVPAGSLTMPVVSGGVGQGSVRCTPPQ